MDFWFTLILVVDVIVALCIIGLVLLQHGKGADVGAAFGSGASGSLFGASGSANFLSRSTAVLAAVFFATSLGLTWFAATNSGSRSVDQGVMGKMPQPKQGDVPAVPSGPAPTTPAAPAAPPDAGKAPAAPPAAPSTPSPAPASSDSKSGQVPK